MADPLSVVASIAGILAFAAKITNETITIVTDIRDAPGEITDLRFELQNLSSLVQSTYHLVSRNQPKPDDKPLEDTTTDCLQRCVTIVNEIQVKLQPFLSAGSGRRSPLPQSWSWVFHKAGIRNLKDRLRNSRAMLSLSVTVLTGHLLGKGQHEIMDEMVHGMQRLDRRLQRSENARRLRNKLQSDLQSVSGSQIKRISSDQTVFSDQTDGDFSMRKMLEDDRESPQAVPSSTEYQTLDGVDMALLPADIVDEVPALLRAAQAGNVQQVRALLSLGASPSPRLPDGRTALHFCAIYDDAETAEALVKYGADVNAKDDKQRTPFRIAVSSQSFGMAALLMRKGSEVEKSIHLLLDTIRTGSGPGFVDFLAALRERWDNSGPFMVHEAIEFEDNDALDVLLGGGFDPNRRDACGISPIHHAIIQRRKTAVQVLLRHGADINDFLPPQTESLLKPDTIPWHRVLQPPMLDCGITPLGTAGRAMYDVDMVRLLLEAGADPNFLHSDGGIVTMGLCLGDYNAVHKLLVEFGADLHSKNRNGHTAIYYVVIHGNLDLARFLLDRGVNPSTVCEADDNSTLLHVAIRHQFGDVARLLVKRGANLGARDAFGRTPMMMVEEFGDCGVRKMIDKRIAELVDDIFDGA